MLKKIILFLAGSFVLLVGALVYVVFFSSIPLKLAEKGLKKANIEVTGLTGSYNDIAFEEMSYKSPNAELEIRKGRYRTNSLLDAYRYKRVVLESLEAQKVYVNVLAFAGAETSTASEWVADKNKFDFKTGSGEPIEVLVKNIDLSNISIKMPNFKGPVEFSKIKLVNLHALNETVTLDSFLIDGNCAKIDIPKCSFMSGTNVFSSEKEISLAIRPCEMTPWLRREVDIGVKIGEGGMSQFEFNAFSRKLTSSLVLGGDVSLNVQELSVPEYFNWDLPIERVNLTFGAKMNEFLTSMSLKGGFEFAQTHFEIEPVLPGQLGLPSAIGTKGDAGYSIQFIPGMMQPDGQGTAYMMLSSTAYADAPSALKALVFDKKAEDPLSPDEAVRLSTIQGFFLQQGVSAPTESLPQ